MRTMSGCCPGGPAPSSFCNGRGPGNRCEFGAVERRWGVLFQQGALFSSLTMRENLQFPIREYLNLSQRLLDELAIAKLEMVGLDASALENPSEFRAA